MLCRKGVEHFSICKLKKSVSLKPASPECLPLSIHFQVQTRCPPGPKVPLASLPSKAPSMLGALEKVGCFFVVDPL